jgi:ABC-2 type transport system ATP-binding protein
MAGSGENHVPLLIARELCKTFRHGKTEVVRALDGISLVVGAGMLTALVGPDGAGKTTLLRLAAGLLNPDSGQLKVLGVDVTADPQQIQARIGYMPQKFGLYEDLTVQENLDLYADLHGLSVDDRRIRYPSLMSMTALGPFRGRLAGRLSGGMKQKLGVACTLVRSPELLLLDEPTVGVDPLSRRELWEIIQKLVNEQGLTVLVSTSYLDEAERCGNAIVLNQGKVLTQGLPSEVARLASNRTYLIQPSGQQPARELQARLLDDPKVLDAAPEAGLVRVVLINAGNLNIPPSSVRLDEGKQNAENSENAGDAEDRREQKLQIDDSSLVLQPTDPRFEDGFMVLLRQSIAQQSIGGSMNLAKPPENLGSHVVVEVRDLVRKFGAFTAVDHVSFEVHRGEIFGLLGPNGAGKTTTFRMLCGLLAVSSGTLEVAGVDLHYARASARQRIGYVAQKFSLYGQLSVDENLDFFASAYGLRGRRKRERIAWAIEQFELGSHTRLAAGQLPGGYKQRLAMAAALVHEPEILFLDEPTSGADPLARREFWRRITALAQQGVTIIVTTHFMVEAAYCDRIVILDAGRVLAQGTPAEVRSRARHEPGRTPTMEDAFISIVEESRLHEAARSA